MVLWRSKKHKNSRKHEVGPEEPRILHWERCYQGVANPDRWAPSDSWILGELVWKRIGSLFPAPPSLLSSPFPRFFISHQRQGLGWDGRRLACGSHVTKASLSHPPWNTVPRAAAAAACCCPQRYRGFAGRAAGEQRLQPPPVLSRWLEEASPNLVPGHRVLLLSLTWLSVMTPPLH